MLTLKSVLLARSSLSSVVRDGPYHSHCTVLHWQQRRIDFYYTCMLHTPRQWATDLRQLLIDNHKPTRQLWSSNENLSFLQFHERTVRSTRCIAVSLSHLHTDSTRQKLLWKSVYSACTECCYKPAVNNQHQSSGMLSSNYWSSVDWTKAESPPKPRQSHTHLSLAVRRSN